MPSMRKERLGTPQPTGEGRRDFLGQPAPDIVTGEDWQRAEGLKSVSRLPQGLRKLSQHETDGREFQERESVAVEIFPVLGQAAATVEPRNRAFDDPTLG